MLGLDIDEQSFKLVEVKETAHGWKLTRSVVQTECLTAKVLQKTIKTLGIKEKEVYLGLAGKEIIISPRLFPAMPEKDLREAVFWEAKNLISFPIEDAWLSFCKIGEKIEDGNKKIEVFLAAGRREYIEKIRLLVTEAGLKIKGITFIPFAVWDFIRIKSRPSKETGFALLDIREKGAVLYVFVGDNLKFIREMPLDLSRLNWDNLTQELLRTIGYVQEKNIIAVLGYLFLTGEIPQPEELKTSLSKALGLTVEILNPLENIEIVQPGPDGMVAASLLAALGLALGKTRTLNLLNTAGHKTPAFSWKLDKLSIKPALSLLLFFLLLFSSVFAGRVYLERIKAKLQMALIQQKELLLNEQQKPKAPAGNIREINANLSSLYAVLPSYFKLEELSYDRGSQGFLFWGSLSQQEKVGDLLYKLQSAGKYREVKVLEVGKMGSGIKVKISLGLK